MKVIIEDGLQTLGRPTGIGTYTSRLRNALLRRTGNGSPSPDVQVTFNQNSFFARVPNRLAARLLYLGWISSFAEPVFRARGADVVHITANYTAPFKLAKPKLVFTIHDLTPFKAPDTLPKKLGSTPKLVIKHAIKKADIIITLSETIKREILYYFPDINEEKIVPCRLGTELANTPPVQRTPDEDAPYFLFVGTLEKRKNLPTLVMAFSRLVKERRDPHIKLVLVGKPGYQYKQVQNTISAENMEGQILLKGYVQQETLSSLYASATAFVMPSRYEGFGSPLVEAMAYGVPIIASDIPIFHEVLGDAAIFYGSPADVGALTRALYEILDDNELGARLVQNGTQRTRKFTFDRMAESHIAAYTKALET